MAEATRAVFEAMAIGSTGAASEDEAGGGKFEIEGERGHAEVQVTLERAPAVHGGRGRRR